MITYRNLIGFKPNRHDNSPSFSLRSVEVILHEYLSILLLLVAVCWYRVNIYKPSKWTFFRILHNNRVQNIIQFHDKNIWKQMCIKNLCYSTETYLQYTVLRGGNRSKYTCELYITNWSYSNKLWIVFATYQRMRTKGGSWAGPCLMLHFEYLLQHHILLHILLLFNPLWCHNHCQWVQSFVFFNSPFDNVLISLCTCRVVVYNSTFNFGTNTDLR